MESDDLKNFKPLRMIVRGGGGSGKSVFINTVISTVRRMFENNGVVQVVAPTGVAAFNANGQTMHSWWGMQVRKEFSPPMSNSKKKLLKNKMQYLLALFIDERSMVSSSDLGSACEMTAEATFKGHLSQSMWGCLPVVVLVGDDYQLPSVGPGVLSMFKSTTKKSPMTRRGELCFREFAQDVFELEGSKRIKKSDNKAKQLNERLRVGNMTEEDMKRLEGLDLANVGRVHGSKVVKSIKKSALHLYANNAPIEDHNLWELANVTNCQNPLACINAVGKGNFGGKAVNGHFDKNTLKRALLCRGCKVAIAGKNFWPGWGLFNSACGTVVDIVFKKGENPNDCHLP